MVCTLVINQVTEKHRRFNLLSFSGLRQPLIKLSETNTDKYCLATLFHNLLQG